MKCEILSFENLLQGTPFSKLWSKNNRNFAVENFTVILHYT